MIAQRTRTAEGGAATEVVLQTFRVNGLLLAGGDRLETTNGTAGRKDRNETP